MKEEKVNRSIRKYIYRILKDDDKKIFALTTMPLLGEYLFQKIKKRIRGTTDSLIKGEISRCSAHRILTDEEYYLELINQIGIKVLPKEALELVVSNYGVVKKKYEEYETKAKQKLSFLQKEINEIESATVKLQHLSYNSALNKDLTIEFDQLNKYFLDRERVRTYKEIIEFDRNSILKCVEQEIGYLDKSIKQNIIKEKTLSIIMGVEYAIENNTFKPQLYHIDAAESNLSNELVLFFKAKFIPIREKLILMNFSKHFAQELNGEDYDVQEDLKILPKIQLMIDAKNNNSDCYLHELENLFNNFNIVDELKNSINCYLIQDQRKQILNQCLSLFVNTEYDLLVNLLPMQIEGVFYDLLVDSHTYQLFNKLEIFEKPTLRDKLDTFKETIHIDIFEYFKYYFNNLIRNVFAHGRGTVVSNNKNAKIMSYELLLDLNSLMYYYTRRSEFTKMRFLLREFYEYGHIKNDKDIKMDYLFETLCRYKHISILEYGVERYDAMQVLYWILNPTYEKIYAAIFGNEDLLFMRNAICNFDFWQYVNQKILDCIDIGYDYMGFNNKFDKVLDRLIAYFKNDELKKQIITIRRNLKKLKRQDEDFQREMNSI